MAKFTNKKEQVYDLKLTAYGRYLISIGDFRPSYYAFYDDNILYDSNYAGFPEQQNHTEKRIKEETQYLESLVLFEDVEESSGEEEIVDLFDIKITPTKLKPRQDIFKFGQAIGDAYLDGESQSAPAWKIVALNGLISSSFGEDLINNSKIPQLEIDLNYKKVVQDFELDTESTRDTFINPESVFDIINSTATFADNKVIKLRTDDALIYADEVNTELLNENFDIEVFEIEEFTGTIARAMVTLANTGIDDPAAKGLPIEDDTIKIGDGMRFVTFTFKDSAGDTPEVEIGADIDTTMENLAVVMRRTALDLEVVPGRYSPEGSSVGEWTAWVLMKTNLVGIDANTAITYSVNGGTGGGTRWRYTEHGFHEGTDTTQKLHKKYFQKEDPQIRDGFMVSDAPIKNVVQNYTTASVEYYFDILSDFEIPEDEACKAAQIYNKESYYIDLDFECDKTKEEAVFYDIYGVATEPEICQS
jgi:hypothetical protein